MKPHLPNSLQLLLASRLDIFMPLICMDSLLLNLFYQYYYCAICIFRAILKFTLIIYSSQQQTLLTFPWFQDDRMASFDIVLGVIYYNSFNVFGYLYMITPRTWVSMSNLFQGSILDGNQVMRSNYYYLHIFSKLFKKQKLAIYIISSDCTKSLAQTLN